MKKKKILIFVSAVIFMLSVVGCAESNGQISGGEATEPSGLTSSQSNEDKIPSIIGEGGVSVAPAPEEETDGTMSYGELRLRAQDDEFQFSTDGGQTWSSDWESSLPAGYGYMIDGDTLEVSTDDGCATMTK